MCDCKDHRLLLRHDLLHFVVIFLALRGIECCQLQAHQLIDAFFPGRMRRLLGRPPEMERTVARPDIHTAGWIEIIVRETEQNCVKIKRICDFGNKRIEIQRRIVDMDTEFGEIAHNQCAFSVPDRISRIRVE